MTESRSPRLKPRAARPSAKSRTWSWYWRHVQVCQMPRSFSRIAGRSWRSRAFRWSSRASVVSATGTSRRVRLRVSKVRLDHARIGPYLVGRALGDLLAHVQHRDAVGDVHDHAHVVLDQDHGDAPLLVDVEDEARHVLLLLVIAAAHRLVEEQDLRVEGQGPAELDALLQAVGQGAGGPAPEVLDPQEIDDVFDALAVLDLFLLGEPPVGEGTQHAGLHVYVAAEQEIVEDGHAPEEGDVLEGAGDAELGDLAGGQVGDVAALADDPAGVGVVEAADHVEDGRLAGAVGPDDREDFALLGLQGNPGDRLDTAKRLGCLADFQKCAHESHRFRRR